MTKEYKDKETIHTEQTTQTTEPKSTREEDARVRARGGRRTGQPLHQTGPTRQYTGATSPGSTTKFMITSRSTTDIELHQHPGHRPHETVRWVS